MTSSVARDARQFSVLMVCAGNICRSPLAEQLLRARLAAVGVWVAVRSAGTQAVVGGEMTQEAVALSRQYGGLPEGHEPRQLTAEALADAGLVLTATREQRSEVVSLHPRAADYTYTLSQFARVMTALGSVGPFETNQVEPHSPVERAQTSAALRDFIAGVAAIRGFTPTLEHPTDDDITDPYKRSQAVYDRVGEAIDRAVTTLVSGFATALGRA